MTWKELQDTMQKMGANDETPIFVRIYDGFYNELYEDDVFWYEDDNGYHIEIG